MAGRRLRRPGGECLLHVRDARQVDVGANRLLGIWWAGKLLYPREFDVDLRAKVIEFHRRFYHREPSAAQLDAMLGEPGVLPK